MHHAIQIPLRVDLLAPTVVKAGQSFVVADVGKHRLHRANSLAAKNWTLFRPPVQPFHAAMVRLVRPGYRRGLLRCTPTPQACPATKIEVAQKTFLKVAMSIN